MEYAVVCRWKDNPIDFQVLEYFQTAEEAFAYIETQPKKPNEYTYEVMKYD